METDEEERKVPALRIKLPSNATSESPEGEEGEEEGMEVNGGMEEENGVTEVPVEFDSNDDDDDDEMLMPPVQVEVEMNNDEDEGDEDEQN